VAEQINSVATSSRLRSVGLSILAYSLGLLVAIYAGWTTINLLTNNGASEPSIPNLVLEGLVIGAILSIFQWLILRSNGLRLVQFVLLGSLGLSIGLPIGELLADSLGWIVAAVIFGIFLGAFQWIELRRLFEHAERWVLGTTLAWTLGAIPSVEGTGDDIVLFLSTGLLFGLVLGIFTAGLVAKQPKTTSG